MSGDLPTSEVRVNTGSNVLLVETSGSSPTGPGYEYSVDSGVILYSADTRTTTLDQNWVIVNSDGTTPRSCERWLRVRFAPPFGAISSIRFWSDNYDPDSGWEILWGLASTYSNPAYQKSNISVSPLPQSDPGILLANIPVALSESLDVGVGQTLFTDWMVFQASWKNSTLGLSQPTPINLNFAWREA